MRSLRNYALAALAAGVFLSGCAALREDLRHDTARRLATPAWMIERPAQTGPFVLMVFERMHQRGAAADVYIGAGGPTPANPVALHLATRDLAENVAFIARPCQYPPAGPKQDCGGAALSEEVLQSYGAALDEMKSTYGVTGFNLVGFDDGAALAAMLAARRYDALSLRSVAGRLDLIPPETVRRLAGVPQRHFAGVQDESVSGGTMEAYLRVLGPSPCAQGGPVQEAAHEAGWVAKWPRLLALPVSCAGG